MASEKMILYIKEAGYVPLFHFSTELDVGFCPTGHLKCKIPIEKMEWLRQTREEFNKAQKYCKNLYTKRLAYLAKNDRRKNSGVPGDEVRALTSASTLEIPYKPSGLIDVDIITDHFSLDANGKIIHTKKEKS